MEPPMREQDPTLWFNKVDKLREKIERLTGTQKGDADMVTHYLIKFENVYKYKTMEIMKKNQEATMTEELCWKAYVDHWKLFFKGKNKHETQEKEGVETYSTKVNNMTNNNQASNTSIQQNGNNVYNRTDHSIDE